MMNQLLALVCSTARAIPLAMEAALPFFSSSPGEGFASGVASFGPDGEPLASRRPATQSSREEEIRRALTGGVVLHQLTRQSPERFRANDGPPYRFRRWLAAILEDIDPLAREDMPLAVPPHIAKNMKTQAPSEELFHLFLGFMHSYRNLEGARAELPATRKAVHAALSTIQARYGAPARYAWACSDGSVLVVTSREWPLWYAVLGDTADARTELGAGTRVPLRSVPSRALVVTDSPNVDAGWERLPDGAWLQADRVGRYEILEAA
jgi:glutamine amidotransferase